MAGKSTRKKSGKKVERNRRGSSIPAGFGGSPRAEVGTVTLAHRPSIKDIAGLKQRLAAACEQNSTIVVDAEKVESIDTAALQLLAAFVNSIGQQANRIEWKNPSVIFCEMADLLDLSEHLGIGVGISGDSAGSTDDELCPVF